MFSFQREMHNQTKGETPPNAKLFQKPLRILSAAARERRRAINDDPEMIRSFAAVALRSRRAGHSGCVQVSGKGYMVDRSRADAFDLARRHDAVSGEGFLHQLVRTLRPPDARYELFEVSRVSEKKSLCPLREPVRRRCINRRSRRSLASCRPGIRMTGLE
jgi:hypothetical protein